MNLGLFLKQDNKNIAKIVGGVGSQAYRWSKAVPM